MEILESMLLGKMEASLIHYLSLSLWLFPRGDYVLESKCVYLCTCVGIVLVE